MASLRGVRRRVCGQKKKFFEEDKARRDAHIVSLKTGEEYHAYRCPFGDGNHYHIGHKPRDIKKRQEERLSGRR